MNLDKQVHSTVCCLASHIVLVFLSYQLHIIDGSQTGDVRLVGGSVLNEGRVEIFYNGTWGTVCDDGWGDTDASVVCRQLGMGSHALATCCANFGDGVGTIWLDDVYCSGSEASLSQCTSHGWGVHDCSHYEDAGVVCHDVRLAGGSTPNEGRVEILSNGTWGTVCHDAWDDNDASVVCRQLRMGSHALATCCANFGEGIGTIWLDNVHCSGSETSLSHCTTPKWGVHNCGHSQDAGVICHDVRLVGGSTPNEGRVEVYYNGIWGTVCDNSWGDNDASVVCRQLGMGNRGKAKHSAFFGEGVGTIWMDRVTCVGDEVSLTECASSGWGVHSCGHHEDAGVYCQETAACLSSPCLNDARCVEQSFGYMCICQPGYQGENCENDANLCTMGSCLNGGTCVYQPNGTRCICDLGYYGDNCEYDANLCTMGSCLNGGTCSNQLQGTRCICNIGYHGDNCEYDANLCTMGSCLNGGTCINQLQGTRCICDVGHYGDNCEYDANLCTMGSCLNGGTCINQLQGTRCICDIGYHGDNCEYDANLCTMGSCLNGGTCSNQPNGTRCICNIGYHGDNCESDANLCTMGSCLNGGTCINQLQGTRCICDIGHYGDNCEYETTSTCKFRVCYNGATCIDQPDGIKCICPVGYHGNSCEYGKNWVIIIGIILIVLCSVLTIAVAYLLYALKWKQRNTPPAPKPPKTAETSGVHNSSARPTNQVNDAVGSDNPAISGEDPVYELDPWRYENSAN